MMSSDEARVTLEPGQRVSRVYPYGGTGTFDPARCSPDTCGSYQVSAGTLAVRWDSGRMDTRRRTLFAASAGDPIGMISVEGEVYARS
jgi:hypothetical protein